MAGALGLTLGGTSSYDGEAMRGPTFGTGRSDIKARDIRTALSLYRAACGFQLAVLLVLTLLTWLL
jgi:adenosylcobinamide-phosphate synthase